MGDGGWGVGGVGRRVVGLGGGVKGRRVEGGLEALGNCKRVTVEMVIIIILFR